tara:strand:+ start:212 stop:679 length:468 start_codon:yes stop_codon:yes gene_type:complete
MTEDCSSREFARTITNIRPYKSSRTAPKPNHDPLSENPPAVDQMVAIRETPDSRWEIAKITEVTDTTIQVQYFGTTNPDFQTTTFRPMWTQTTDARHSIAKRRPSTHHQPYTGEIDIEDLPELLLSNSIQLTTTGALRKKSAQALYHLRDQLLVH